MEIRSCGNEGHEDGGVGMKGKSSVIKGSEGETLCHSGLFREEEAGKGRGSLWILFTALYEN